MSIEQESRPGLAAELGAAAPDAGLVGLLEGIDPATLGGEALGAHVQARWRVHNRAEAQLLEGLHHLGRAEDGRPGRRPELDEFSGDELRGLLGWSRTMATRRLDLADDLFVRLPEVGDALHEGVIDEPKARTICEWTGDLAEDHAHRVCGVVLGEAPGLPVGALQERIEQIAVSLDPDWAERRRRRAESRARVILSANPSGTATLSFVDAPVPEGIASQARIDGLAAAIRRLGVLTPVAQLRLQVGMRLLDGSTAGMDDRSVALLLASEYHAANTPEATGGGGGGGGGGGDRRVGPDDAPAGTGPGDTGPGDTGSDDTGSDDSADDGSAGDGSADDGSADDGSADDGSDSGPNDDGPDSGPNDDGPDDGPRDGPDGDGPDGDGPDGDGPDGDGPDGDGPDGGGPDGDGPDGDGPDGDGPDGGGPDGDGPDGGGPDGDGPDGDGPDGDGPDGDGPDGPGEGPRSPSGEGASGEVDEQGVLDLVIPTDGPGPPPLEVPEPRAGRVRQGIVEVRLRLTTALGLDDHPGTVPGFGVVLAHDARGMILERPDAEWRVVLTDDDGRLQHVLLARRRPPPPRGRQRTPGRRAPRSAAIVELQVPTTVLAALRPDEHGAWAPLLVELQHRLTELGGVAARSRPPDADTGPDQWARRRPGAEVERWVQVRDRHCLAPSCRRPAHRAELDHTRDHALRGPTASWNLGALCTHDHRAEHVAGWQLTQPAPGRFVIRTRAGITHTTEPRRVIEPLPAPRPAARPRPLPDDGWNDDPWPDDDDPDPDPPAEPVRRITDNRNADRRTTGRRRTPTPTPRPTPTADLDDPPPF
ncbi:HNH endonuclease signature motif containing protein [Actinomycetospora cinnamomea]|uniref:Uncharacterized protein DUF222 n=1 Tax=Actinomycetospora cinnamomea TaxID=663609 RepID=A0A2U1F684_9PSEU|nr:HNH endonuclease signature motif containing protein [Actinomycetospora cinnamomea]PVZ07678.1 uncharacterized protein DUF222 [Actinomycetospora cinnamomea]